MLNTDRLVLRESARTLFVSYPHEESTEGELIEEVRPDFEAGMSVDFAVGFAVTLRPDGP